MRIGVDATALYGRFGGIENAIWNLLVELRRLDTVNRYIVYVPADAPEPPQPANPLWEWRRLPFAGARKARRIVWQQLELPRQLVSDRCELVHSLNYVMPLTSPVPAVVTMHDLIALNHSHYALRNNRIHYRAIMPGTLSRAARIIVPASRMAREAAARTGDGLERVRVVPLGVDELFFQRVTPEQIAEVRRIHQLPARFCLFLGNFEPKKNLPNLLRAFDRLESGRPHSPPLVIAGGVRPWTGHEKTLGRVQLLGYLEREQLPALFAASEVFCFPSLSEGFGLPVLEALASGVPVVASSAVPLPGLRDVALLAEPRSPASIAGQVERLLDDDGLRSELRAAGRAYAREFTWLRTGERVLKVYRELGAS